MTLAEKVGQRLRLGARDDYYHLRLASQTVGVADGVRAIVTVTSTGNRPTRETMKAYMSDVVTSATWADRELKGFAQVDLERGAQADVEIAIPVSDCSGCTRKGLEPVRGTPENEECRLI